MDLVQTIGWTEIVLRLCSAALIGSVLGLNRELLGKPAGMRTNALVSLGSALVILAGLGISPTADVNVLSRVMQGIITGIGFLGAGVILHDSTASRIHGLTTAATIWLSATLGILCGAGIWSAALVGVALTLVILVLGKPLERWLHRRFPNLSEHDHDGTPPRA
jgi:putative Mg2+ transporter-C (MgtC) family protein